MTLGSHQNSIGKSQVHITPRWILDALGSFDTDPCAATVRPWDCARVNYTVEDDGLSQQWRGRCFVNPPFHRYQVKAWVEKLAAHDLGVLLVHARTETEWFRPVWENASAILFLSKRVIFNRTDGGLACTAKGLPANSGAPVVLAAFGDDEAQRLQTCGLSGALVDRWQFRRAA